MYGLCTSADNRGDMFTDRQVATDCNAYSILIEETRGIPSNGFGNCTWRRRLLSTNTISTDFLRLSFTLLVLAQARILSNSVCSPSKYS